MAVNPDTSAYIYLSQKIDDEYLVLDSIKAVVSDEPGSYGYLAGDSVPIKLNAATRNIENIHQRFSYDILQE